MSRKTHSLFLAVVAFTSCSYLPEEPVAPVNLKEDTGDYAVYYSGENPPLNAFLFVPGGLVDPYVYSCWIDRLATSSPDVAVVLVKYPSNLAISNIGKAMNIAEDLEQFDNWVIGGHSLGGVVATTLVYENPDFFDATVLMASWSRESTDLSDWNGSALSFYASADSLASKEEIEAAKQFLPPDRQIELPHPFDALANTTFYFEVKGGNHAGFGCYGPQDGDGEAQISAAVQQDQVITVLTAYFNALW